MEKKEMLKCQAIWDRLIGIPEGKEKEKLWQQLQDSIRKAKEKTKKLQFVMDVVMIQVNTLIG